MKRIHVMALIALSSALLLFGCGKKDDGTADALQEIPIEQPADNPEETPAPEEETPATDEDAPPSEGMMRSPLTNEWVDEEVAKLRPIAVMIPNDSSALPQYNISNADILYECLVEGGISRLMGVFGNWTNLERVGNIRSCRDYFIYWAFEYDAIYCHFGGPFYIDEVISRSDTQNINGLTAPSGVYYRTTDRKAPQNAYLDGQDILKEAQRLGYPLEKRDNFGDDVHFQFASESKPNTLEQYSDAVSASEIDLSKAYPVTKPVFTYNSEDGLYYRSQKPSGGKHIDAVNNKQLSFKNVLVQFAHYEVRDAKGYLAFQCNDTTKDGYLFTNGKGIHVTWEKKSDYEATRFFDDDGNEIQLNTGKTMVCVLQDGSTVEVE